MADGQSVPVWTFGSGFNSDRSTPAPIIELTEGRPASIILSSMMPHTIHPHGLDVSQAVDGMPGTSGYVSTMPMVMGNFGRVAGYTRLPSPFNYAFTAPAAGTYAYHCHVDTVLHMEMGMVGMIIVRPADGSTNRAWTNGPAFDKEYVWQLQTFDSRWHRQSVSGPPSATAAGTVQYRPDYFMINGRDGSNLLYDTSVAISGSAGMRVLARTFNSGNLTARVNLGLPFEIIASDGRPLPASITTDQVLLGPGERYDIMVTLPQAGTRSARVEYLHITGRSVRGSATTNVTSI